MLDLIFGSDNFRNEIIWQKVTTPKAQTDGFGNVHDSILFYSKSHDMVFNEIRTEHRAEYLDTMYRYTEQNGRRYRLHDFTQKGQGEPRIFGDKTISPPPGKHWIWSQDRIIKGLADGLIVFSRTGMPQVKRYLDVVKGHRATDIWMDVKPIGSMAKERLPYPTQKPLALLERIIEASSNEDDTVLDPFCGCGTTIEASQKLERHWMGIDVTWLAISLVESRLKDAYKARGGGDYKVYGNPIDFSSAQKLAIKSKREFELWAISLVEGAFPRREYDGGVDGIRGFREKDKTQTIVIQVKGGDVLNPGMVRDLHGTVSNERAAIGLLVSLKEPTKGMRELAAHGVNP